MQGCHKTGDKGNYLNPLACFVIGHILETMVATCADVEMAWQIAIFDPDNKQVEEIKLSLQIDFLFL